MKGKKNIIKNKKNIKIKKEPVLVLILRGWITMYLLEFGKESRSRIVT